MGTFCLRNGNVAQCLLSFNFDIRSRKFYFSLRFLRRFRRVGCLQSFTTFDFPRCVLYISPKTPTQTHVIAGSISKIIAVQASSGIMEKSANAAPMPQQPQPPKKFIKSSATIAATNASSGGVRDEHVVAVIAAAATATAPVENARRRKELSKQVRAITRFTYFQRIYNILRNGHHKAPKQYAPSQWSVATKICLNFFART